MIEYSALLITECFAVQAFVRSWEARSEGEGWQERIQKSGRNMKKFDYLYHVSADLLRHRLDRHRDHHQRSLGPYFLTSPSLLHLIRPQEHLKYATERKAARELLQQSQGGQGNQIS